MWSPNPSDIVTAEQKAAQEALEARNKAFPPLKPYQFWGMVRGYGFEQALRDFVAAIPDPVEQGVASAMLEFSLEFRRDHPLVIQACAALGMTSEELDGLWVAGQQI